MNIAPYPLIDITNVVISRMLLGGPGPDGSDPRFKTRGAVFYEVRSVGQKSNGRLENMLKIPTMAVLTAAADGSIYSYDFSGYVAPLRDRRSLRGGLLEGRSRGVQSSPPSTSVDRQ